MRKAWVLERYGMKDDVKCERPGTADSSLSEGMLRDHGEATWQRAIEDAMRVPQRHRNQKYRM